MNSSSCLSQEKKISVTQPIAIRNKIFFLEKGLKQNSFNPLKDSPPNNFLLNLLYVVVYCNNHNVETII